MNPKISKKRRERLVAQLQVARDALVGGELSLRSAAVLVSSATDARPTQTAVLLVIVNEAKLGLEKRLSELGVSIRPTVDSLTADAVDARVTERKLSTVRICIRAGRACGQALGAAFREAQKVADAASTRVLYGPIRDLEKQLWLLDPCQAD